MTQDSQENGPAANDSNEYNSGQTLGSYLKRERLKKQLSIEEVAEQTCINLGALRAIEENDRSKMPAEVFARGFIRLYAKFLGLDPQDTLERYNRETGHSNEENIKNHEVFQNEKMAESSAFFNLRTLFFVLIFLVIAGIVGLGLYFFLYSESSVTRPSSYSSSNSTNSLSSQINQKFKSVEIPVQNPSFSSPSQGGTYSAPASSSDNKPQRGDSPIGTSGNTGRTPQSDTSLYQPVSPLTGQTTPENASPEVSNKH